MNRIYEVEEGRPFWRMRPMQLIVTVISVTLCAVALVILVVSGPVAEAIGKAIGVGDDLVAVWDYAKWPVLALVVMLVVALLYYATPNVKLTRFRLISVGAFVAIVIWLVASVGFAFYVANFSSYNATYGSLAGAIVVLLWLWITNIALLFGAELDAELERGRELQIGIAAEETLQLPVRDTRGIEKATARRSKDVDVQRDIRLAAAGSPGTPATGRSAAVERPGRSHRRGGRRPARGPGHPRGARRTDLASAAPARGWSPGASRSRARSGRRTRGRPTGAGRSPAGATRRRAC